MSLSSSPFVGMMQSTCELYDAIGLAASHKQDVTDVLKADLCITSTDMWAPLGKGLVEHVTIEWCASL